MMVDFICPKCVQFSYPLLTAECVEKIVVGLFVSPLAALRRSAP